MNILRLFFAGLIAFAPVDNGTIKVFLLDGLSEQTYASGDLRCISQAHMPQLVARKERVVGSCEGETTVNGLRVCVWSLKDVDIFIHGLYGNDLKKIAGRRGVEQGQLRNFPRTRDEALDLSWIADIDAVTPDGGEILADVLSGHSVKGVTGRLTLTTGLLQTCHLVEVFVPVGQQCIPVMPLFRFRQNSTDSPRGYDQALADEVGLEAGMDSRFLSIFRVTFSGEAKPPIILSASDSGELDALIVNLPPPLEHEHAGNCGKFGIDFSRFFAIVGRERADDHRKFIPHVQPESVQSHNLQPVCGDSLVQSFLRRPAGAVMCKGDPAPYTRPICPMSLMEPR